MRAAALGLLLTCSVAGCAAGRADAPPTPVAAPCSTPTVAGAPTLAFTSGGVAQRARLDLPPAPAGTTVPLIVALHFAGGTGSDMAAYTRLSVPARAAGFAVVYPTATADDHVWRLRRDAAGRRDVRLIMALLAGVKRTACIDTERTYVTGVSNGAGMAARLACALGSRLRAIAAVAPGLKAVAPCHRGPPVGILEIHGLADRVVPYAGSGSTHAGSVPSWLADWRRRDHCTNEVGAAKVSGRRRARVLRTSYGGCVVPVMQIRLEGTDHGWPGSGGPLPRHDPTGISSTDQVVRFFQRMAGSQR